MGKFHLFAGTRYYPYGGMEDYQGSFDSQEEAIDHLRELSKQGDDVDLDWANLAITAENGELQKLFDWVVIEGGEVEERI